MDKTFNSQRDVIVVTANYRLGVLGWLSGKAVQQNTTDGTDPSHWHAAVLTELQVAQAILVCKTPGKR